MKTIPLLITLLFTSYGITQSHSQQNSNHPVVITLSNTTQRNVSALLIDFNGQAKNLGNIPPGRSIQAQTTSGHLWMLLDGNNIVGTYRATNAHNQTFATLTGVRQPAHNNAPQHTPRQMPQQGNLNPAQIANNALNQLAKKHVPVPTQQLRNPVNPVQPANPQSPATTTGSSLSSSEARQVLAYHNQVRREVGVADVTWSPEIAKYAQQWADHLARTGKFEHRPQSQQKYGENLAGGSGAGYTIMTGLQNWYGEKRLYNPPRAPFSMKLMPAGHYTQMVWRSSTQIGAGKAVCQTGQYKGWTILVCNYNPRGNMIGQPAY